MEQLGPLVEVEVSGLLGRRDIRLKLAPDAPTVITGGNGTGKSTVLRIVDSIARARWWQLRSMPFSRVALSFGAGVTLDIGKLDEGLNFTSTEGNWVLRAPDLEDEALTRLHFEGSYLVFDEKGGPVLRATGTPSDSSAQRLMKSQAGWLADLVERFKVLFITDQRLVIEDPVAQKAPQDPVPRRTAVEMAAHRISREISASLSQYATHSQELDRKFPQRVVEAMTRKKAIAAASLKKELDDLAASRRRLQRVGLLPREDVMVPFGPQLDESIFDDPRIATVIGTYVEDTRQKLSVLGDVQLRLSLLVDFLNQHYSGKEVVIDPTEGLIVTSPNGDGSSFHITDLSSGEQQILVLAFEVLFSAEPGTLILIDEPELSLHVLWQDTLIDDLKEMGDLKNVQFLLATHSPTLLGGRFDLQRSLDPTE